MPRTDDNGTRTFIDGTVLGMVEKHQPHGVSRTGYINYLIQLGLSIEAQRGFDLDGHLKRSRGPTREILNALTTEGME